MIDDEVSPFGVSIALDSDGHVCVVMRIHLRDRDYSATLTPDEAHEVGQTICAVAHIAQQRQVGMSN